MQRIHKQLVENKTRGMQIEMIVHEDGAISMQQGTGEGSDYLKVYPEGVDNFWGAVFNAVQVSTERRKKQ